jgi:hypothetical protein
VTDQLSTTIHRATLWTLTSAKQRKDPWSEITLVARLTGPDGKSVSVPAFWDGGEIWRFRLSAPAAGKYELETVCSDTGDTGLHGKQAVLEVGPAAVGETNPFSVHGAVRIAANGRHFEHVDGTPFYWLADTWWMLMSERVSWPDGFKKLTAHRVGQGFTVGQVVIGFQPDTTPFDGRDANAGGSPWHEGYSSINPGFFQAADRRIEHMVDAGILPLILGGWGYHLLFMGKERMISHWRYLVARYGAWPVLWCLAGEGAMAYYLSDDPATEVRQLQEAWPDVAKAVHQADPWQRPLTLHCRRYSWDDTTDPTTLDFHMTQAGHFPNAPRLAIEYLAIGRDRYPNQIIINAEPPYEGHGGTNWADVQRYSFWSSMLSGASGFTYGAAGVFQANDRERPTGNRPDGGAFDHAFWDDAIHFPGAEQVAKGHALLASLNSETFSVHPEWASIKLRGNHEAYLLPMRAFAAGVPGKLRVIYLPLRWYHWDGPLVQELEPGVRYKAAYIETDSMKRHEIGEITGDVNGEWRGPTLPHMFDWVLLLEAV